MASVRQHGAFGNLSARFALRARFQHFLTFQEKTYRAPRFGMILQI